MQKETEPTTLGKLAKSIANHPIIWFIAVILLVSGTLKLIDYAAARYACHARWVDSSVQSQFTLRGGCLVEYKGSWIPEGNFRIN